jgi:hypothetical protein
MRMHDVWYSSESRLRDRSRWIVYDDIGELNVASDSIDFIGRRIQFSLAHVERTRLVHQPIPRTTFLLASTLGLLFLLPLAVLLAQSLPVLGVALFVAFTLLVSTRMGLVVSRAARWVEVSGVSSSGEVRRCFFADGSRLGWGGIFGGTRRLYEHARRLTRDCS